MENVDEIKNVNHETEMATPALQPDDTPPAIPTRIPRPKYPPSHEVKTEPKMVGNENTASEEKTYIEDFEKRVKNKWVFDIDKIATEKSQFWIDNRKYIQKDKYLKYNLLKRIELWEQIIGQLDEYTIEVNSNIEYLDSIILDKEKEIKIVYWVFRPQDIGLR